MQTTLALVAFEVPTKRDLIIFEGHRYYTSEGAMRMGARGSINLYEYDATLGESGMGVYKFQRYRSVQTQIIDASTELIGSDDVWYLAPKRYSPPNLIYSNEDVVEITAGEWFSRLRMDTLVFDWHIVTHAHGKEGGGRGKTERAASVEFTALKENGVDASYIRIRSANSHGAYRDTGEYVAGESLLDKIISVHQPLYAAGRSFIFSDRILAEAASEAGLIGRMPVQPIEVTQEADDAIYALADAYDRSRREDMMSRVDFQRRITALFTGEES